MQQFLSYKKKSLHKDNGNNGESICVITGDGFRTPATPECCLTYNSPHHPTFSGNCFQTVLCSIKTIEYSRKGAGILDPGGAFYFMKRGAG